VRETAKAHGGVESTRFALKSAGPLPAHAQFPFLLQETAGNRAVAGLMHRWRDGSGDAGSGVAQELGSGQVQGFGSAEVAVQRFAYKNKTPTATGITMEVQITDDGKYLRIVDKTNKTAPVGDLTGFIQYRFEVVANEREMVLEHFEAQPAGSGLGTLLMWELAQAARNKKISTISVATPALSAMGAYAAFGGVPRDADQHEKIKIMYLQAMLGNSQVHDRFVNQEAQAVGEGEAARASYADPSLTKPQAQVFGATAKATYEAQHTGQADMVRAANLMALSSQIIYKVEDLNRKMFSSLTGKWDVT
jgi:hypothetical protein